MAEIKRPETREEMTAYMASIDIYEADRYPWEVVFNGWASDYAEAEIYLDTLGIFPWDD